MITSQNVFAALDTRKKKKISSKSKEAEDKKKDKKTSKADRSAELERAIFSGPKVNISNWADTDDDDDFGDDLPDSWSAPVRFPGCCMVHDGACSVFATSRDAEATSKSGQGIVMLRRSQGYAPPSSATGKCTMIGMASKCGMSSTLAVKSVLRMEVSALTTVNQVQVSAQPAKEPAEEEQPEEDSDEVCAVLVLRARYTNAGWRMHFPYTMVAEISRTPFSAL